DKRSVHRQSSHRGPARWGQRHDSFTLPAEMLSPGLRSRVEQRHLFASVGISDCLIGPLAQRTRNTRQGEIVGGGGPTDHSGPHVVNMKRRLLTELRQPTVIAP